MDCAAWGQCVEGLSFVLVLSGIKLPLMWAVRHRCTGCGRCHIEADIGWCQTEERAREDGDALVRMVPDGLFTLQRVFVDVLCAWGWAASESRENVTNVSHSL